MIEFFIPGTFKAKGRPRFDSRSGHAFTPKDTESYEAVVRQYAKEAMAGKPLLEGPLAAEITFIFPRPKSKKLEVYHISRPDVDNCLKTILDAMNGIVYQDDSAVVRCEICKYLQAPKHIIDTGHRDVLCYVGVLVKLYHYTQTKWTAPPKPERKRKVK